MTAWRARLAAALLAGVAGPAGIAGAQLATAQEFPAHTITMIVPFPAGGPVDAAARLISVPMAEKLGKSVVIENIGGAGTSIGSLKVARAAPDGHTLLLQNLALAATGVLYPQYGLDPAANFSTVGFLASNALVLVGRKDLPPASWEDLVAWMRANHAKVAHPGVGTTGHLTSVVLAKRLGVGIDLVPYRGAGPALQDTVAGHVDLFIGTPLSVTGMVQDGTLKAYGVTAGKPIPQLPNVPSLAGKVGPDLEVLFWTALFAPAGTPKPVIVKLADALQLALASPSVVKAFAASDMQPYPKESRTPEAGDAYFRAEVKRWSALVHDNNIKAE